MFRMNSICWLLVGFCSIGGLAVHASCEGSEGVRGLPSRTMDSPPPEYSSHVDLRHFMDEHGQRQPIRSVDDWLIRKKHILQHLQTVMGQLPGPLQRVPLDVKTTEEVRVGSITRRKLTYQSDPADRVPAYLFIPDHEPQERLPAVLCLQQTTTAGKAEPAGLAGDASLHYALHLAQRGYVTLAPDYPSFGEHRYEFGPQTGYASGSMKAVWDNIRAVDVLETLGMVDAERIGCIGHSLGGHNTMFTAAFEPRLRVLVSNCGFCTFQKDDVPSWTGPRYMPRIASDFQNDAARVPFDFPELIACFAPRPFLASAAEGDSDFDISGVRDCVRAARPIYELMQATESLDESYYPGPHAFPENARTRAYEFLDRHLKRDQPAALQANVAAEPRGTKIVVTIDRGRDLGQSFGSLFEAASADGSLVIGAGFPNAYNTRYRADRHEVQFFIRPTGGQRTLATDKLPRPNDLCGTYLYSRDGTIRSTYGGLKVWNAESRSWQTSAGLGGTEETMRLGDGVLEFGSSTVSFNGRRILEPPTKGTYELFFYAHGHLCFYHVNRGDAGYRPYQTDADGFSKLHACPWTPDEAAVDLSRAIVLTLPIVGETTFAWGQLGSQIVTGSNIGGFYVFEQGKWRMLLEPKLGVSYQLYSSMAFHDRLLMGQYPTGRVFAYDGEKITDQAGWPPKLDGVSGSAREAQTTAIYGGDVLVGVWPWGEVWRYNPDSKSWSFMQRMFDHPELSDKITHPYDEENRGHAVGNLWGQRVTSLVPNGPDLFVSTSAKHPLEWSPQAFPFLAPDKWRSYGTVYRLTMPGHLSAPVRWTKGPTTIEFIVHGNEMSIRQDGQQLASATIAGTLAERSRSLSALQPIQFGTGLYGPFTGASIDGGDLPR